MSTRSAIGSTSGRLREFAQGRHLYEPSAIPVYICFVALLLLPLAAVLFLGFGYDAQFAAGNFLALAVFTGFSWAARWVGFPNLAGGLEAWMLLLGVSMLTAICAFIVASLDRPPIDDLLSSMDMALFGFDRRILKSFHSEWPAFYAVVARVYTTLNVQPFILLAILFGAGQNDRAWRFLLAWSFALSLCLAISPLAPAYGTPPYELHWIEVFEGARDGSWRTIEQSVLTGIITFPSFHAAGAAVLAWGFSSLRVLRVPLLVLNVAVVVSAVLVGGHYIVDILAGLAVAAIAVRAASHSRRQDNCCSA